ncbi:kelch repeat and BTB domain-containing protein 13 [Megalops cyprinoides]|uniref:kelch repeat and BTB domain-containing protein 13 n=1 Tax=Megalops cyprinoides TaxID=118141 RepID=UPI0018646C5B|nr:kelch repeat and BTB domain-containing protein 13 [Megalops cyprinoides]
MDAADKVMEPSSCSRPEVEAEKRDYGLTLPAQTANLRVTVEGNVFTVDRATLARGSEYFRALFRSGMRDCQQEEVDLKGLSARGFAIALRVMRGERPVLNDNEIEEAVECAAFLQVEPLVKHLLDAVNSDNCVLVYHTAAAYGLLELYHGVALFIRDMYHDLREDVKYLPEDLIEYVESLTPSTFVAVGTHTSCTESELCHAATRTICYLDEDEEDWKVLTHLPMEASTSMAGVTVLDNKLYVVGGVSGVHKQAVESCFCYDAVTDTWSKLASPQQLRYNFSLVGQGDHLYAIGGECERRVMSSVEMYCVSTGVWSFASHLPRPAAGAACAKAMSRIFVCLWKPMETTDIYEYVPGTDEWALVTTLIRHQSYGHCMAGHRDNLYVMRNGPSDDFLRCMMDCYSLTSGQWTAMPGHYTNSKGALFTAVVRGDSVFTVNRTMTLEYAIEDKKWKPKNQMRGFPRSGSMWTFLLRLPRAGKQPVAHDVLDTQKA